MSFSRRYKVIQFLEWFELGGGLETITGEIALGLNPQEFDVEIWCVSRGGKLVEEFRSKGIVVKVLNIHSYFNPFQVIRLALLLKQAKADIVHAHVYFASTIARAAAKLAGIPVIIHHVHSTYWHYSASNLRVERFLARWTDKIICVSQAVRSFVVDHERIDAQRTEVVYNGITRKQISARGQLRKDWGIESQELVIVVVASLLENKGHKILLRALNQLKARRLNFKCLIVGEGVTESALRQQAQQLDIVDDVMFLGVRTDVPDILSESDLFVLPSIEREGLPVSIIEAMAYGVAVIASRVGGVSEIVVDQDNGVLVAPSDVEALAERIYFLAVNKDVRQRMVDRGRAVFAERFEARVMIGHIETIYRAGLKSHGI